MERYDVYPVNPNEVNINSNDWELCYSSTLSRAKTTAKTIYNGKIVETPLIVEVPLSAFIKTNARLHYMVWQIIGRVAWLFSLKSQKETRPQTIVRINEFIKILEKLEEKNILIVSHGFFMKVFVNQLKKIGFKGKLDFSPKNGKLYLFEK
jgi:broad specificity phosphatase PhoE